MIGPGLVIAATGISDGREYDITGTPGFFIGNEEIGFVKINGAQPFDIFKRVIDAQLET